MPEVCGVIRCPGCATVLATTRDGLVRSPLSCPVCGTRGLLTIRAHGYVLEAGADASGGDG